MPFDITPKTEEEQRIALGRIALEAIAAKIVTLPPERFDLGAWREEDQCGTVGCAIGHGCELPEVQATGLRMTRNALDRSLPVCGKRSNWEAVEYALGIAPRDSHQLFDMYRYPDQERTTAVEVAVRIREYLAR